VGVLRVAVVADRHPDVVQQRGRPQQLALVRLRLDHALGHQRVVELEREPRDVVGVADVGVELQREVADRGDADVGEQRRRAAQQPPREEHPLAQARAGELDAVEAAVLEHGLQHHGRAEDDRRVEAEPETALRKAG
jgi:hypothetical protein